MVMKQTNRKCPKCGYVVENESARYCKHCGTELPATVPASASSASGSVARRMAYMAGVCIVCVVVAAIALYKSCGSDRAASDAGGLKGHEEVEPLMEYVCDTCDMRFSDKASFDAHKKLCHQRKNAAMETSPNNVARDQVTPPKWCPFRIGVIGGRDEGCLKSFRDMADYVKHMYVAHNEYQCPECPDYRFKDIGGLRQHFSICHSGKERELMNIYNKIIQQTDR